MLVNQIQRDMNSMNQLEVMTALLAVCKLVTVDMIPAVIGEVVKLLSHDVDSIRKKSICALHRSKTSLHVAVTSLKEFHLFA